MPTHERRRYGPHPRHYVELHRPTDGRVPHHIFVFFHGGSWRTGAPNRYRFFGQRLARQGILSVMAAYRLYPEVRFPTFLHDAAAATTLAVQLGKEHGLGMEKVVIGGHSAGAHIAAMLALEPDFLRARGMSANALGGLVGMSGPYAADLTKYGRIAPVFRGAPETWMTRPTRLAARVTSAPPTLLLHGEKDRLVHPRNAEELKRVLEEKAIPVSLKRYPRLGHVDLMLACHQAFAWRGDVFTDLVAFLSDPTAQAAPARDAAEAAA